MLTDSFEAEERNKQKFFEQSGIRLPQSFATMPNKKVLIALALAFFAFVLFLTFN